MLSPVVLFLKNLLSHFSFNHRTKKVFCGYTCIIGYGTKLESGIKPYIEVGGGLSAADGVEVFDGDTFTVAEVGASIPVTEKLSAKAKFEHKWGQDDARDWKFEVGTKYKF